MPVVAALDPRCRLDPEEEAAVFTPALAVFPDLIKTNLDDAIAVAGGAGRLRPHVKTHKTAELVRMEIDAGITKHKAATIAEAELLARAGASDVLLAYTLVGPNVERFARLQKAYVSCRFRALVDHQRPLQLLGEHMAERNATAEMLIDVDVGMGRTGVPLGDAAAGLYRTASNTKGIVAAGLHVYDGQNHQLDGGARYEAVLAVWERVKAFARELESQGMRVPRIVCGNSPTFPAWARIAPTDARIECSPGTFFLNDWNYYHKFEDLPFPPAAVLLTRVISKPRPGRLTLDLGYKAVASDPPLAARVKLLSIPDAEIVLQNEEHLVIDTSEAEAERWSPGDLVYAWPGHICPSCALHRELLVVREGRVVDRWQVVARDRVLSI